MKFESQQHKLNLDSLQGRKEKKHQVEFWAIFPPVSDTWMEEPLPDNYIMGCGETETKTQ